MHTFADLAKTLNRSTVYLSGLQSRFELPVFEKGAAKGKALYVHKPKAKAYFEALEVKTLPP